MTRLPTASATAEGLSTKLDDLHLPKHGWRGRLTAACKACRSSPPHLRLAAPERKGAGATQGSKGSYRGPRHGLRGWCALSEACHTRLQAKRSAPGPPAVAQQPWKSAATVSALLKILTLGCRGRLGGGKTDQAGGVPDLDNRETAESSGPHLIDCGALAQGR